MTLKDRLITLSNVDSQLCPVGELLASLDAEDAEALRRVLASKASTRAIHTELAAEGYRIGRDTMGSHRNGWCRCPESEDK